MKYPHRLLEDIDMLASFKGWTREVYQDFLRLQGGEIDESEAAYRQVGRELGEAIWRPVAARLEGIERVFVVPDGAINLVSLAALPFDETRFLVDSGPTLHYLSAARDLLPDERQAMTHKRSEQCWANHVHRWGIPGKCIKRLVRRDD